MLIGNQHKKLENIIMDRRFATWISMVLVSIATVVL